MNFRSHPSILSYPNEMFYGGQLRAHADQVLTHSMLRSDVLPNPRLPIVFHSVCGKDMREGHSPSFFNIEEATVVKNYIRELKQDQRLRLSKPFL